MQHRQEMPLVYELLDLITDPSNPRAYGQNFDDKIRDEPYMKKVWLARERVFQKLEPESWLFLKSEACPYLMKRHEIRGWEQLISILNQAWAYDYLNELGCIGVHFIPRSNKKFTPDLEGMLKGVRVLCEVKTVNISKEEAERRQKGVYDIARSFDEGLFWNKVKNTADQATKQIESYEQTQSYKESVRRIMFLVLNFDDFWGRDKADYYRLIDRYLGENPFPGIEIVFFNQRTTYHRDVEMQTAVVINEAL